MKSKSLAIIIVTSKFHLYGAFSYIIKENLLNQNIKFIILALFHEPSKLFRVTESDCRLLENESTEFIMVKTSDNYLNLLSKQISNYRLNNVLVINPVAPNYHLLFWLKYKFRIKNIKQVLIDEGIGMYNSKDFWDLEIRIQGLENHDTEIKKNVKKIILFLMKKIIHLDDKNYDKFSLFNYDRNGCLLENKKVIKSYYNFFNTIKNNHKHILHEKKSIVIVSDNLGFYLNDVTDEVDIYNDLIKKINRKYYNFEIYLKPHPNELCNKNFENLENCKLLKNSISMEELIINNREIGIVMGFCSTAMLTSSVLFDKETVCLVDYIDTNFLNIYGQKKIESFKKNTQLIKNVLYNL
jgi:hypothetical protein